MRANSSTKSSLSRTGLAFSHGQMARCTMANGENSCCGVWCVVGGFSSIFVACEGPATPTPESRKRGRYMDNHPRWCVCVFGGTSFSLSIAIFFYLFRTCSLSLPFASALRLSLSVCLCLHSPHRPLSPTPCASVAGVLLKSMARVPLCGRMAAAMKVPVLLVVFVYECASSISSRSLRRC